MRRTVSILSLFVLLTATAFAKGPPEKEETWYSVHLDGRRIGHMHAQRQVERDGRIRHEQALVLTVERNGQSLRIASDERSWETADGAPLSFESRIDTAGSVARTHGELRPNGTLAIRTEVLGKSQESSVDWPAGALMPEGQRLAAERAGYAPGTRYLIKAFDPGSLTALRIRTRVRDLQDVEMHGRTERLILMDQTLELGGVPTESQAWVTPDTHELRRLRLPAIGLPLEMLACDRACALAPVQPVDIFASTLVSSPEPLSLQRRQRPIRYRLRLERGRGETMAQVPGQRLEPLPGAGEFSLIVDPHGDKQPPPDAGDLSSTRWLQADDGEVQALARRALRSDLARVARGEHARAAQLERFVRDYINIKSLRVGYASASEIVRGREGDCTEHAVLLASLMRASGIPARVATGIAYAPGFGGHEQVFVPHAWVMAWVDEEWRGFDAALAGFDAGHIAFSVGDGDPFRFYGGIELLGALDILSVERVSRRELQEAQQ